MIHTTGNKLEKAIARQIEKTEYFCTAENISPNLAVHELRKSFKRLRAWLRFYLELPDSDAEIAIEEIRQFGKILSPLRESFVNIDLFDKEITGKKLLPERKIKTAKDKILKINKSLTGETLCDNEVCNKIREFFSDFESHFITGRSIKISKITIFNEVNGNYSKSFLKYTSITEKSPAEEIHSLRKKLKRLFYQFDFIRFFNPRYFKSKTNQLNRINNHLGIDHDLHVFLKEVSSGEYDFNSGEIYILGNQIEYLTELNRMKLFPLLKQFFNISAEEFDQKLRRFFKL